MNSDYKESFEKSRIAGFIAAGALSEVAKIIKPGISTNEIDKVCYEFINDHIKMDGMVIPVECLRLEKFLLKQIN